MSSDVTSPSENEYLVVTSIACTRWILVVEVLLRDLCAAAFLTSYVTSMLYTIEPLDLMTFAGVTAALLFVSLMASSVPAYRAARMDPMKTLLDQIRRAF